MQTAYPDFLWKQYLLLLPSKDPTVQAAPDVFELLGCFQQYLTKQWKS